MMLKGKHSAKNLQKPWSDRWEYLPLLRLQHPKENEPSISSFLLTPLSLPRLSEIKLLRVGEKIQNHLAYTFIISTLFYLNMTLATYEEIYLAHLSGDSRAQHWFELQSQLHHIVVNSIMSMYVRASM